MSENDYYNVDNDCRDKYQRLWFESTHHYKWPEIFNTVRTLRGRMEWSVVARQK